MRCVLSLCLFVAGACGQEAVLAGLKLRSVGPALMSGRIAPSHPRTFGLPRFGREDLVEYLRDLGGTPDSRLIAFDVNGVVAGRHANPKG